jgi:ribosomal protein S18 acetylase RimI-like enzyme
MRVAVAQDGVALLSLWREAETVPGHTGDLQSIDRLMRHDSNAVIVAGVDGRIVGSVIAGWDGWRGSIHRLAVAPSYRRQAPVDRATGRGRLRRAPGLTDEF